MSRRALFAAIAGYIVSVAVASNSVMQTTASADEGNGRVAPAAVGVAVCGWLRVSVRRCVCRRCILRQRHACAGVKLLSGSAAAANEKKTEAEPKKSPAEREARRASERSESCFVPILSEKKNFFAVLAQSFSLITTFFSPSLFVCSTRSGATEMLSRLWCARFSPRARRSLSFSAALSSALSIFWRFRDSDEKSAESLGFFVRAAPWCACT